MSTQPQPGGPNLALIATVAIPLMAIVASLFTVGLAVVSGDRELPEQYHWEGFKLDRDFARFERAVALNVQGTLSVLPDEKLCRMHLTLNGTPPEHLNVALVHATIPSLDQHLQMRRNGDVYEQQCAPVKEGSWRIEVADPAGEWSVRQTAFGSLAEVDIRAVP